MTIDRNKLEILDEATCWQLLAETPVGRLAYCERGRPHIVPVNHAVLEGDLVIVTRPGGKLDHARDLPGAPIAYEIDHTDEDHHTGWSVVVEGELNPVTDRVRDTRIARRVDPSWIDTFRERRWLILEVDELSGRRLPAVDGGNDTD